MKIISIVKEKINLWRRRRNAAKSVERLEKKAKMIEEQNRILEARNKQFKLITNIIIQALLLYVIFGLIFNLPYAERIIKMILQIKSIIG